MYVTAIYIAICIAICTVILTAMSTAICAANCTVICTIICTAICMFSPKSHTTVGGLGGAEVPLHAAVHLSPCAAGSVQPQTALGSRSLPGLLLQPATHGKNMMLASAQLLSSWLSSKQEPHTLQDVKQESPNAGGQCAGWVTLARHCARGMLVEMLMAC